jgi:hypothetical protein
MTTTIGGSYPAVNSDSDATINGLTVGKGAGSSAYNTVVGAGALAANTSGIINTAVGSTNGSNATLSSNTSGNGNNAFGAAALGKNTTANQNNAFGYEALRENTTGANNTAMGGGALTSNTTASNNTAVGYQAGYSQSGGSPNITAVGYRALYSNTTGTNDAFGFESLRANTTGDSCAAFGYQSLQANTTGSYNVASGLRALYANTTGASNTSFGTYSLYSNTTGSNNTAVGYQALYTQSGGTNRNTALGQEAGYSATNGQECTFLGYRAGYAVTSGGGDNTFVGGFAGSAVTSGYANTILGKYTGNQGGLDIRTANNYIVLSDGSGNPRGFCIGNQWYFGNQTAPAYWPQTTSVSGQNAVSIDRNNANLGITSNDASPIYINRNTSDGDLIRFYTTGTQQGNISVSGSTVSYNGGHLSRWSQLLDNSKDDTILKGTVMSNLDNMCVWEKDGVVADNEQLNKMKVSDLEGDINVAGVFVNWSMDEQYGVDDMNIAMTGDMIIRIAQGVVVAKGDLLMSAGDGTAKPQGDDIRRSKTVAKVTSNNVTCTYADGSYCVPCVLMAC